MAYADSIRAATAKMGDVATLIEGLLIAQGSDHEAAAATSTTSTSYVAYRTAETTLTIAANEKVLAIGYLLGSHGTANGKITITVMEDAVDTTYFSDVSAYRADTNGQDHCIVFPYIFSPAAGSRTYSLRWKATAGTIYSTRGGIVAIAFQNT